MLPTLHKQSVTKYALCAKLMIHTENILGSFFRTETVTVNWLICLITHCFLYMINWFQIIFHKFLYMIFQHLAYYWHYLHFHATCIFLILCTILPQRPTLVLSSLYFIIGKHHEQILLYTYSRQCFLWTYRKIRWHFNVIIHSHGTPDYSFDPK